MRVVLYELAKVQLEVAVVPVGLVLLVHLSARAFGAPAGGVAFEPDAGVADVEFVLSLDKAHVTLDLFVGIGVAVVFAQKRVPFVQLEAQMNLRKRLKVIYIRSALFLLDVFSSACLRVVSIVGRRGCLFAGQRKE